MKFSILFECWDCDEFVVKCHREVFTTFLRCLVPLIFLWIFLWDLSNSVSVTAPRDLRLELVIRTGFGSRRSLPHARGLTETGSGETRRPRGAPCRRCSLRRTRATVRLRPSLLSFATSTTPWPRAPVGLGRSREGRGRRVSAVPIFGSLRAWALRGNEEWKSQASRRES